MTREQERINAACEYAGIYSLNPLSKSLAHPHFLEGAKWADKTMVDKFLYWLTMKSPFIDNKDMDKAIVELKKYLEE